MKPRRLQPPSPQPEQPERDPHVMRRDPQLLSEAEAAGLVPLIRDRKHPVRAFRTWARKAGVPIYGRVYGRPVYDRDVVLAFVQQQGWTVRHRPLAKSA